MVKNIEMSRIRIAVPPLLAPRAYVWDITVISNRRRLKIPLLLALRAYNTKLKAVFASGVPNLVKNLQMNRTRLAVPA